MPTDPRRASPAITIIDRYVIGLFLKIFLVCFTSLFGLYVVIDMFANLEEFLVLAKQSGGLADVLVGYYAPRMLDFFNRTGPLIVLVSAICAITLMQRANEMAAIEGAGIPKLRVVKPIFGLMLVILGLAVVNRELLLPRWREKLVVNVQDLARNRGRPMRFFLDVQSGIGIRGAKVVPAEKLITDVAVELPAPAGEWGERLQAEVAIYLDADPNRPHGFWLKQVRTPADVSKLPPGMIQQRAVVFGPSSLGWLESQHCFVPCQIDFSKLAFGPASAQYTSWWELVRSSRQASGFFSNRQRVELHARLVQPLLDMAVVLLGLPLVISRRDRNLFVAAGICLMVVIALNLTVITCQALGAARLVHPPALAAWLPVIVFVPLVSLTLRRLSR